MKKLSLVLLLIIALPSSAVANTIIHNSVSTTANSGTVTTKIKTIHNGEVVENISISTTTPYQYQSTYFSKTDSGRSQIMKQTDEAVINQLKSLINELRLILSLYEKLLAQQNTQKENKFR